MGKKPLIILPSSRLFDPTDYPTPKSKHPIVLWNPYFPRGGRLNQDIAAKTDSWPWLASKADEALQSLLCNVKDGSYVWNPLCAWFQPQTAPSAVAGFSGDIVTKWQAIC